MKVYKGICANHGKIVEEDNAQEYVLDMLGIKIEGKDKGRTFTLEQLEFLEMVVEWYFSGNWVKEEIKEDDGDVFQIIKEECELEDEGN